MVVHPVLTAVGLAGLGVSAGANVYAQYRQRQLYRQQANAYSNLHRGYTKYLKSNGRQINPDRAWTSYYGQYQRALANYESSYAGSFGTVGGSIGAGSAIAQHSLRSTNGTFRRLPR